MPIRGEMKFDKRILARNVRAGIVSQAELDKHFKKLPDLQSESDEVEAELKALDREIPSAPESDEDEL